MGIAESHFGQQVKKLRSSCGISQEELGFLADMHTSHVSKLERGVISPSLGVILKIAGALGLSGAELLRIVEESMPSKGR